MRSLRKRLPPLGTLLAFEAAARHLSFTLAAGELGVSQAAVSRQIRSLEDHLETPLFRRLHREVRLTLEGERLQAAVTMSLGHIAETTDTLRRQSGPGAVSVCTTIAFSAFWLMPRIERFREVRPDIELKLIAAEHLVDLAAEGIDLGVRYGDGLWPDVTAELLFRDEVFPICSPAYLEAHPGIDSPADLVTNRLLHQDVTDPSWLSWEAWLSQHGVALPRSLPGPSFNNYVIVLQAAQAGQGIALGWGRFVEPLLESGTLVPVLPTRLRTKHAFHLVSPRRDTPNAEALAFRDWLLAEAER